MYKFFAFAIDGHALLQKVDENGNALGQAAADAKKNKKKKQQTDKNVVVLEARDVSLSIIFT